MQRMRAASFMTQQDIGGDYNDYINDVELLNAPNTTAAGLGHTDFGALRDHAKRGR
jgi:hypothetical protein